MEKPYWFHLGPFEGAAKVGVVFTREAFLKATRGADLAPDVIWCNSTAGASTWQLSALRCALICLDLEHCEDNSVGLFAGKVAHEATHAMLWIGKLLQESDGLSEEVQCYLVQYIVQWIWLSMPEKP